MGAFAHTDGVICISSKHQAFVTEDYRYPIKQTQVIPNGVNEIVFRKHLNVDRAKIIEKISFS